MTKPFWRGGRQAVYHGDAWELAGTLKPQSVDCVVTSPPYWGLRDYGNETRRWWGGDPDCRHRKEHRVIPAANGITKLEGMTGVSLSTRSATRKPRVETVCSRCGAPFEQFGLERHPQGYIDKLVHLFVRLRPALKKTATIWLNLGDTYFSNPSEGAQGPQAKNQKAPYGRGSMGPIQEDHWLRPKQLLLIPSRVAIAMQEAGFILRNDMLWVKRNPDAVLGQGSAHLPV